MKAHDKIKKAQWETLNRFTQSVQKGETPEPEAMRAGLEAVIEKMDALKATQGRKAETFYIDSPQFGIAMQYVKGELKYGMAIDMLCNLSQISIGTAKKDLKEMKPRAKETLETIIRMKAIAVQK